VSIESVLIQISMVERLIATRSLWAIVSPRIAMPRRCSSVLRQHSTTFRPR
jgi:hypothetical protein